jgi:hypothetical membrane protein
MAVPRLGPLVRREVRLGGALLIVGSLQFLVAMLVVQLDWPGHSYSDVANYVSDLGGPQSPLPGVFNHSIQLLGVLGVVGTLLIRSAFPPKTGTRVGLFFLLVAEVFAFLVGTFPEGTGSIGSTSIHTLVSSVTFVASALALLALGFAMLRDTRWDGYRAYTFFSGVVTWVGIALFAANVGGSGVQGALERVIIAPILLWAILAGLHLARMRTFAPSHAVST